MKTLRHTIAPEEEGRMVKQIARGAMGASHRLFSQVKFAGGVLLDGERALANARVRAGQVLELRLAEEAAPEADATHPAGAVNIVYEDEDLFVVDKCAPLPCQSSARQTGDTLEARMRAQMPGWTFRPVNRLDKGTSGLMVVARHAHAQDALQRDLHTDDFVREYLAVVEGAPQAEEGWIDAPIRKAADRKTLWQAIRRGEVQTVSTDHCSFTTAQKLAGKDDFTAIPGGLPGVETRGELIYTFGVTTRKISLAAMCRVLAEMETAGFLVDRKALAEYGQTLQGVMDETEQAIYAAAGETFNINSPKQLGVILFEKLGLPHGKKTKTGWSTNADVLEKLRYDAPIVADVLRYRQYAKLKSTYVDGLMKVTEPDGRVRTSFQMTVTATGRLSSTEPNLQNIPTRTELGSQLRRMFTAPEGCVLVDADYSQIELRLLAHIAGDTEMQAAFRSGADFHTVTASRVFHVEPQEVTPEMRRRAKAVNFGIVYGISAFSLAQDIGVSVAEAKAYMERYFETYQGVRQYMTDVVAKAEQDGYVQTLMHRRRALPELKSSNFNMREFGKRVALNMPVQGTAADILKLALGRLIAGLPDRPWLRPLLQIHDELVFELPEEKLPEAVAFIQACMDAQPFPEMDVPIVAEAAYGPNFGHMKEME